MVKEEGRVGSRPVDPVVDGELSNGKPFSPIILLVTDPSSKIFLNLSVQTFSLSIHLFEGDRLLTGCVPVDCGHGT